MVGVEDLGGCAAAQSRESDEVWAYAQKNRSAPTDLTDHGFDHAKTDSRRHERTQEGASIAHLTW